MKAFSACPKKVMIAMSGGVDSSVAAALMKDRGFDCIGMYLQFWHDPFRPSCAANLPQNKCCTSKSLEDARKIAAKLKIPFYVSNVKNEFKAHVVDYFLKMFAKGQTPNPCIQCNGKIKFGFLLKKAVALGADFLATGHYARKSPVDGVAVGGTSGDRVPTDGIAIGSGSKFKLLVAADKEKDQSYFLYHLTQNKLKRLIFPLGELLKSQVYEIAKKKKFIRVSKKKQSQGLCFFAEATPENFLKRHLPPKFFKAGKIVTVDGREIGMHKGLPLYTIGQRHGLGIGGVSGERGNEGWYVVEIDRKQNRLIVGRKRDLMCSDFFCGQLSFVSGHAPDREIPVEVRVRYRSAPVAAKLAIKKGMSHIITLEPVRAVCEGQSAVFYQGENVIGGGIIKKKIYGQK